MLNKEYVDESEERILNDEFKNWKKSVSFLYDMVMTHALHWPSFTLEWLPSLIRNGTVVKSRLLLGATTDSDKSHVLIADVYLPCEDDLDPDTPLGTFKSGIGKIELHKRLIHRQAVSRARHMPQKPQLISTTSSSFINIFDTESKIYGITDDELDDFASIPDTISKPLLQLSGFSSINPVLAWNPTISGLMLGSGDIHTIGLWDFCSESASIGSDICLPTSLQFRGHTDIVTELSWWPNLPSVFLSSSLDCSVGLWDIRSRNRTRPSHSITAHKSPVLSVAPNPFSSYVFGSGSEDGTLALWDVRNLSVKLHSLGTGSRYNESISSIRWSPHLPNLVAAAYGPRTIAVWDIDTLHDPEKMQANSNSPEDPPELVFLHGGHSSLVRDLSWHPDVRNVIASTANDNIIQIWKPIENLLPSVSKSHPLVNEPEPVTTQNPGTLPQSEESHQ